MYYRYLRGLLDSFNSIRSSVMGCGRMSRLGGGRIGRSRIYANAPLLSHIKQKGFYEDTKAFHASRAAGRCGV